MVPEGGEPALCPLHSPGAPHQVHWLWMDKQNPVQPSERTTDRWPANPWPGQVEGGTVSNRSFSQFGQGPLRGLLAQPGASEASGTLTSRATT